MNIRWVFRSEKALRTDMGFLTFPCAYIWKLSIVPPLSHTLWLLPILSSSHHVNFHNIKQSLCRCLRIYSYVFRLSLYWRALYQSEFSPIIRDEAVSTSETSLKVYQTTCRNNPVDNHHHTYSRDNLKSHLQPVLFSQREKSGLFVL
jgi:hypothetical protein